ncbi:MAG: hypothetical protein DI626_03785 [Micavibrio aeruginosavorus]|uniref:DUF4157 domain-containing protein n=1 Tax=Micavibrio aeruginosavorus TaxID=349221 RepID=A0A2W5BWR2_9BACT|nr:MAG: hypothetical protein DI626_03785 [Micavibrio aeruginosavorus]
MPQLDKDILPAPADTACKNEQIVCRKLTAGEIKMAKTIFQDSINYKDVRIFLHPYSISRLGAPATAPDGKIYIHNPVLWSDDYASAPLRLQKTYIHEMTHVWQHQQGRQMVAETAALWLQSPFNYSSQYNYEFDGRDYLAYSHEQQAKMAETFFVGTSLLKAADRNSDKVGNLTRDVACKVLAQHYGVLKDHLPVRLPRRGCETPRP